ncbi:hypothetical protein C1H46_004679 [Malus baccata]|uniref:Calcium-dependent protein kinase n=1 Tax=Malus baccata TaxID=106549 RepID=A0A540NFC0_MALBA|nr:hypothetical protein C1H46_004679 [Malus baccata]
MHHLSEHTQVVRIRGTYEDAAAVHLVMELCRGGELFDRIMKKGHYSEREAAKLLKTIVGVVEACHSLRVMHRDLKPENFLFKSEEEDVALKAVFYKPGMILYILLSEVLPFWAETEIGIFRQILQGRLDFESEPWPGISSSARLQKRITAHEVFCHPWIIDDTIALDKPLDSAVLSRMKQFSTMNKLKKMALRVIAERLSEEEIGVLREIFKMIDADASGSITFDELKEGLRKVGSELMEFEIKDLMKAADIDSSETIDYGEFLAATVHLNKLEREENLLSAFSFFDKDGSGFITIDELSQACREFGLGELHLEDMIKEID